MEKHGPGLPFAPLRATCTSLRRVVLPQSHIPPCRLLHQEFEDPIGLMQEETGLVHIGPYKIDTAKFADGEKEEYGTLPACSPETTRTVQMSSETVWRLQDVITSA